MIPLRLSHVTPKIGILRQCHLRLEALFLLLEQAQVQRRTLCLFPHPGPPGLLLTLRQMASCPPMWCAMLEVHRHRPVCHQLPYSLTSKS
jgi:hypothetical protein